MELSFGWTSELILGKLTVTTLCSSEVGSVNIILKIFVIKTSPAAAPGPYHHGNLAPALVEAALALLDETQDWGFSLREVARRAGVSHDAPYKHFPEKRDLLASVAARGFEALVERTLASLKGVTGARAQLIACG